MVETNKIYSYEFKTYYNLIRNISEMYKKQTGIDIYSLIMKGRGEYIDEK